MVAAQPYGAGRGPAPITAIVEAALFGAAPPVLVVPAAGVPEDSTDIALAWNDSPEALRAARAALPLMQAGRNRPRS